MFAFFVVYLYFGPAAAPGTRGSRRDVLSPRVCVKGCEMYKTKTMDKYGTKPKNTAKRSVFLSKLLRLIKENLQQKKCFTCIHNLYIKQNLYVFLSHPE